MLAVCGDALCENVEGSFLCLCASDLEEYDAEEGHCRPRVAGGETWEAPSLPASFHKDSWLRKVIHSSSSCHLVEFSRPGLEVWVRCT